MNPLKIILLEDEPIIQLDIRACLEQAGHEVWAVSSQEAVWQLCQEQRPDVVILNFHFRGQGDGLSLARTLSNSSYPPQVYFITGAYVDEASVGGLPLLRKPFTQRQLCQFILTGRSNTGFIC